MCVLEEGGGELSEEGVAKESCWRRGEERNGGEERGGEKRREQTGRGGEKREGRRKRDEKEVV